MTDTNRFPDGFVWGAATSAYQVEGSPFADGAAPSFWQRFSHSPGNTRHGDTGDVACDQYARIAGDIAIMRDIGLRGYRFSVSWGRVLPNGTGKVNAAGLAHYDRMIDALLESGIAPNLTLYHWDLPTALDDRGGWLNRDSADWFAEYASVLFRAFDDRVKLWATLNEPWVIVDAGYLFGTHAPGHSNIYEAPIAAHNLLRAHGSAVRAYRSLGRNDIGIVVNIEPKYPASDSAADVAATARADAYMNRHYLDAIFLGRYPGAMRDVYGDAWIDSSADEMRLISERIDWLGVNYYTRGVMAASAADVPVGAVRVRQPHSAYTETGWEVYPDGLSDTLTMMRDRYGDVPLYVTENGAAFYDAPVAHESVVEDPLRVAYYRDHLLAVHRAISAGIDVRGYFAWSLLDNFEWAEGYSKRFGIVHVDFTTQRRTPKTSMHFYADVIRTHGESLAEAVRARDTA